MNLTKEQMMLLNQLRESARNIVALIDNFKPYSETLHDHLLDGLAVEKDDIEMAYNELWMSVD